MFTVSLSYWLRHFPPRHLKFVRILKAAMVLYTLAPVKSKQGARFAAESLIKTPPDFSPEACPEDFVRTAGPAWLPRGSRTRQPFRPLNYEQLVTASGLLTPRQHPSTRPKTLFVFSTPSTRHPPSRFLLRPLGNLLFTTFHNGILLYGLGNNREQGLLTLG